jgi:hypothetical protein
MKELKFGDIVSFDTKEHGMGKGQVIDILESKGTKFAIIEPLYEVSDKRTTGTMIRVNAAEVKIASADEAERRIRMR